MEFKTEVVVIPKVMRALAEKGIGEVDAEQVKSFQKNVATADLSNRIKEFWEKHRERQFLCGTLFVFFLMAVCIFIAIYKNPFIALVGVMLSLFTPVSSAFKINKIRERKWQKSTFLEFRAEYNEHKRSIAYDLCSCYQKTLRSYLAPIIILEVEWHEASNVRFLTARNPDNPDDKSYYVDYWEVSATT